MQYDPDLFQIPMSATLNIFLVLKKRTVLITKETLSVSALKDMRGTEKTIAAVSVKKKKKKLFSAFYHILKVNAKHSQVRRKQSAVVFDQA